MDLGMSGTSTLAKYVRYSGSAWGKLGPKWYWPSM